MRGVSMGYFYLILIIGVCCWAIFSLWGKLQSIKVKHNSDLLELDAIKLRSDAQILEIEQLGILKKNNEILLEDYTKQLNKLGDKYFNENIKNILGKLTANNYATSHKKIERITDFLAKNGYEVSKDDKNQIYDNLKEEYKSVVRKDLQKKEQQRIKELIREEQKLEKERERELRRLESEQIAIEKALQAALKKTTDEHSVEVERLRQLLAEAEQKSEKAKSQAQLTKAGHIYVISNIGSFGKDVFKVGMTRRLEPLDRVRELGDASVPFPFDVHMMISCDNAPALENTIHKELHKVRLNKVNSRKEFFRIGIETIKQIVEKYYGIVEYTAEPEALQYYESLNMSDEDDEFVSQQLHEVEKKLNNEAVDETFERIDKVPLKPQVTQPVKTVPCPHCKQPLVLGKIVSGRNQCHHCEQFFTAKSKAS